MPWVQWHISFHYENQKTMFKANISQSWVDIYEAASFCQAQCTLWLVMVILMRPCGDGDISALPNAVAVAIIYNHMPKTYYSRLREWRLHHASSLWKYSKSRPCLSRKANEHAQCASICDDIMSDDNVILWRKSRCASGMAGTQKCFKDLE